MIKASLIMATVLTLPPLLPKQAIARNLMRGDAQAVIAYGGAQSGKSHASIQEIVTRALASPGTRHLIARKVRADVIANIWNDVCIFIVRNQIPATIYRSPHRITFPNGSEIVPGGLKPGELEKLLGPRYNTILIDESSEIVYAAFIRLLTRLNGIGVGRFATPKLFLTENPPLKTFWTYRLFQMGQDPATGGDIKDPTRYASIHFTPFDNLPFLAPGYIATLENLPTFERRRFLEGEYGTATGIVFPEFQPETHVRRLTEQERSLAGKRVLRGIDFGYIHPTGCLWGYVDRDGVLFIVREYRKNKMSAANYAREILEISKNDREAHALNISDHQSEYRLAFAQAGLPTAAADKRLLNSIESVRRGFDLAKIVINEDCRMLIDELGSYRWKQNASSGDPEDDRVVKEHDDLVDPLRYICSHVFGAQRMKEIT